MPRKDTDSTVCKYSHDHTHTHQLIDRWQSIHEIVKDPHGREFALLQDMRYEDWLNYQIKNFVIRKRVLNQQVTVIVDGIEETKGQTSKQVKLINPDTGLPLLYEDFITDRSGPKFAGYLHDNPATEYLDIMYHVQTTDDLKKRKKRELQALYQERSAELGSSPPRKKVQASRSMKTLMDEYETSESTAEEGDQIKETQSQLHEKFGTQAQAPLTDEEIDLALSIYDRKHHTQRKLSDFDLTARETSLLERAIYQQVFEMLDTKYQKKIADSPELQKAIGQIAWQKGGHIDIKIVKDILDLDAPSIYSYEKRVMGETMHPNDVLYSPPTNMPDTNFAKQFTHMLIDDVGVTVRNEYKRFYTAIGAKPKQFYRPESSGKPDTYYGLGIPFHEAAIQQVHPDGRIELINTEEATEIGDIICDNSSIFGHIMNPNISFDWTRKQFHTLKLGEVFETAFKESIQEATDSGLIYSQIHVFDDTLDRILHSKLLGPNQLEQAEALIEKYYQQIAFQESALMFEEAGKKEGQSQWFLEKTINEKMRPFLLELYCQKRQTFIEANNTTFTQKDILNEMLKAIHIAADKKFHKHDVERMIKTLQHHQSDKLNSVPIARDTDYYENSFKNFLNMKFSGSSKSGKLIGNISDTGPFLKGASAMARSKSAAADAKKRAKAHQQIAEISTLISVLRWGVTDQNNHLVGDSHRVVSAKDFMKSINKRSYSHFSSVKAREKIGLSQMSELDASKRITDYKDGFDPVWQFVNKNTAFYQAVEVYKKARIEFLMERMIAYPKEPNVQTTHQLNLASQQLKVEISSILKNQTPELMEYLSEFMEAMPEVKPVDHIVDGIFKQVEEAVEFGEARIRIDAKRELTKTLKASKVVNSKSVSKAGMLFGTPFHLKSPQERETLKEKMDLFSRPAPVKTTSRNRFFDKKPKARASTASVPSQDSKPERQ